MKVHKLVTGRTLNSYGVPSFRFTAPKCAPHANWPLGTAGSFRWSNVTCKRCLKKRKARK